jgi:hypothetical protein
MKEKSDAYARGILSSNVTHFEAWTGLFAIWLGKMNYPLVATSLIRRESEKIQSRAINASLSKCGFSRTTAHMVVFGSPWFGGLGWIHLYYKQGILHVLLLLKHLRTFGPLHILLHVCLHWYQVITGVSFSPLSRPDVPMPYLDSAWLDSTREFLKHSSAQIEIPEIPLPQLQCENDACIMDRFIETNLPNHTLKRLNLCRLWLRATVLSDICTLPGNQISRTTWLGSSPMPSSDASWPVQPRPQEKSWTLWRKALSKSICTNSKRYVLASRPGELTTKLGAWLPNAQSPKSSRWKSFFEHSTQRLFIPADQPHTYYQVSTSTPLEFSLARYDLCGPKQHVEEAELPKGAVPAQPTTDGESSCINRLNTPAMR